MSRIQTVGEVIAAGSVSPCWKKCARGTTISQGPVDMANICRWWERIPVCCIVNNDWVVVNRVEPSVPAIIRGSIIGVMVSNDTESSVGLIIKTACICLKL